MTRCSLARRLIVTTVCGVWLSSAACAAPPAYLTRLVEARRLAADLRVQVFKVVDASNRAVMATEDAAAAGAVREARAAVEAARRQHDRLAGLLRDLSFTSETAQLEAIRARFADYVAVDAEVLTLVTERSNLEAQRIAFGAGAAAAAAFRDALLDAEATSRPDRAAMADAIVGRARVAVLEIQVLEARHIPEPDAAAMTRMETEMAASTEAARVALDQLRAWLPGAAAPHIASAAAALDRFLAAHAQVVALSRRNSNVRSLSLALGRRRTLAAACDDALRALEEALARHELTATR